MKQLYIVFVVLSLLIFAQVSYSQHQTRDIILDFENQTYLNQLKSTLDFPVFREFIGISAYCPEENSDLVLQYRYKSDEGWSAWFTFSVFTEGSTPGRTVFEGPMIPNRIIDIEVQSNRLSIQPVILRLFFPGLNQSEVKSMAQVGSCDCENPAICERNCWCPSGDCDKTYTATPTEPSHVIIHHSAGHNSSSDYAAVVSFYWDLHVNTNGWDDIGYNWLIDPNGVIYEGRGDRVQGAHFSCMNAETVGICLIGNFETAYLTPAAEKSLVAFLGHEMCDKDLNPEGQMIHASSELELDIISGHLDGNNSPSDHACAKGTVCPGSHVYAVLPEIRTKVANLDCLKSEVVELESPYESLWKFEVYPNPSAGVFRVKLDFKEAATTYQIDLVGEMGQNVYRRKGLPLRDEMVFSFANMDLAPGVYMVRVTTNLERVVQRLVISK